MRLRVVPFSVSAVVLTIAVYIQGGLFFAGAAYICILCLQAWLDDEKQRNQRPAKLHLLVDPKGIVLVDVVAVQGFGSTYPYTWMGKPKSLRQKNSLSKPEEQKVTWLETLLPKDLPKARILAYEYSSKWFYSPDFQSLKVHASTLLDELVCLRKDQPNRPILFIGHSYGGLVIKQTLISSSHETDRRRQQVAEVDRGIAFLGTPHRGAGWRYTTLGLIASVLFRPFGGAYTDVLKLFSDRDGLTELRNEFRGLPSRGKNKRTICFYETKAQYWPLPLGLFVDRSSACLDYGFSAPMECNHSDLNKFSDRDSRYNRFIKELKQVYDQFYFSKEGDIFSWEFPGDLLTPLERICGSIDKIVKEIEPVNGDLNKLDMELRRHRDTVRNHLAQLKIDKVLDEKSPPLHENIVQLLKAYTEELRKVYRRLCDDKPNEPPLVEETTRINKALQDYTGALLPFLEKEMGLGPSLQERRNERAPSPSAGANKTEKYQSPYGNQHKECIAGTRVKTLAAIRDWASRDWDSCESTPKWIFCLRDGAGMGKSTVAKHIDKEWTDQEGEGQKRLVARFFFSRDSTRTMGTKVFCSDVALAFSAGNKDFEAKLSDSKTAHGDWENLPFKKQFEALLVNPLKKLNRAAILTIDALDECDDDGRKELLDILGNQKPPIPNFRILLTSRETLDTKGWSQQSWVECKNFDQLEGKNSDVETYIEERFKVELRSQGLKPARAQVLRQLLENGSLKDIIKKAGDLFIWAQIACDLLVKGDNIMAQLQQLESLKDNDNLRSIYTVALTQATAEDKESQWAMLQVLQMILAARRPLSVEQLDKLSPWSGMGVVERIIGRLGSLLRRQSHDAPVQFLHLTVREFLTGARVGEFDINPKRGHYTLALGSLSIIQSSTPDERPYDYASSSWAYHCSISCGKLLLNKHIQAFVDGGLKTWMSLLRPEDDQKIRSYIGDVLLLSRPNMYPQITETVLDRCLEQIDKEIPIAEPEARVRFREAEEAGEAVVVAAIRARFREAFFEEERIFRAERIEFFEVRAVLEAREAEREERLVGIRAKFRFEAWKELKKKFEERKEEWKKEQMM